MPKSFYTMQRLKDKVAVITGAAQGIGWATARKFMQEGAKVALWDINGEKGEEAVHQFTEMGYDCAFYKVNTTDLGEVEAVCKQVVDRFERIDILINNAGITRDATLKKMTPEQWSQVLDVNLTGVFNCTKAVYPYMEANAYGRIINASSVVARFGNFGQSNYAATKAGLIGMTQSWAREFGRKGITVNAVAPGFIATEMVNTIPEKVLDMFRSKTPLGRLGAVEEVANVYCFLASEEASFVTGTTMSVDGGVTI